MRIVRILPLLALLVGCSGASPTEFFDDPPGGSSDGTLPSSPSSPAPSASSTGTPTTPPKTAPPTTPDPTNDLCTPEDEPNDSFDEATTFKTCMAGKINSRGDVDFGTFDVPDDATRVSYVVTSQSGNVSVNVLMDGQPLAGGLEGELPVAPGMSYAVQVRLAPGDSTARPTYQVKITFK